ncbi:hypothetical protein GW17_00058455 [Ensete ventricosum]|nr:hypothetical protein GW17_00058455 [Ensete ventricosum]RZS12353.1 hypothetical protein BHM03_00043791 [Ensete ventricosum]
MRAGGCPYNGLATGSCPYKMPSHVRPPLQAAPTMGWPCATMPSALPSLQIAKSIHRVSAVGNLPGVRWELVEGIGSLLGWRKGVCQKKIETHWKIVGGSRKAYRDLLGDSSNGSGSSLGARREITGSRLDDLPQECLRLPD